MSKKLAVIVLLVFSGLVQAQEKGIISGKVVFENTPLANAQVSVKGTDLGGVTNNVGTFEIVGVSEGTYDVEAKMIGFKTKTIPVHVVGGDVHVLNFQLTEEQINLNTLVVSGSRTEIPVFDAPVIVSQISKKTFEQTQSLNLGEGLAYSPGLRVETNCQNCGFNQVRMNGLDGAYSQILVNSRPVFSALTGVYGLDLIPANMVERVEVIRGGGSALYGGNAIGGTINIITRDPIENSFNIGLNQGLVDGSIPDRTLSLNGTIVSEDLQKGLSIYGFNRSRNPWDANGDGFSEMVKLENTTFGFDAFAKPGKRQKLKLNMYAINEYRRGGNKFDLLPHQADIAEELKHRILGGAVSFSHYSKDYRHKLEVYASGQSTQRDSYYGTGGRVLQPGDSLTTADFLALNAYGETNDISIVSGAQYDFSVNEKIDLSAGSEYRINGVEDHMPGYQRTVDQTVKTYGNYAQINYQPLHEWSFLIGGRLDVVDINSHYRLGEIAFQSDTTMVVALPRATAMYEVSDRLKLRASFAQGYRAPQAFNEDLHIQTVGGAPRFNFIQQGLKPERSNALTVSANYMALTESTQFNAVIEGFRNELKNPFITSGAEELENGISIVRTRNGSGATVQGANLELNLSVKNNYMFQLGFTAQSARYHSTEEIWAPNLENDGPLRPRVTTKRMLRTPNIYGYFSFGFTAIANLNISLSGVYTGSMQVPHVVDPESEFTIIERTPVFMEVNSKVAYTISSLGNGSLEIFGGVQNVFNAYQSDLDIGINRDANYVYGPNRPRSYFVGLSYGITNN